MNMHIVRILSLMMVGLFVSVVTAESQQGIPRGGEALYMRHCVGCHGATGDGLGPDIKELIVPPVDFRWVKSRTKTDMELYLSIKQGVLFGPMHGWADRLSDQEIWDVLSYIRSVAPFNPIS